MSVATTAVYLYIGYDNARRLSKDKACRTEHDSHLGLVDTIEIWAEILEELYADEFALLQLSCCFDYDVTEQLGDWLYSVHKPTKDIFAVEARRLVAKYIYRGN